MTRFFFLLCLFCFILSGCGAATTGLVRADAFSPELLQVVAENTVKVVTEGGQCTGFIINNAVVTAQHCMGSDFATVVMRNGDKHRVVVMAENESQDIVRLEGTHSFGRGLRLAEAPIWGEQVLMMGHPLGFVWSITTGRVSKPSRRGTGLNGSQFHWVQIAIVGAPGNSGGAIVNTRGEVIGIVSSIIRGTSIMAAVHVDQVRAILSQ